MEKEIDVITLCEKITELTNQEKCLWKETSENNRFKLILKNGSIEVYHVNPNEQLTMGPEYYEVLLYDDKGQRYATYRSIRKTDQIFFVFSSLFKAVRNMLEKEKRKKMALLYNELEFSADN